MCDSENLDMSIYMVGEIELRDDEKGAESIRPWDGLSTRVDGEVEGESCGVGELEDVVLSLKGAQKWSSRRTGFFFGHSEHVVEPS